MPSNINGTSGDDVIQGTPDDDTIEGGKGDDTVFGGDGDDQIEAGPGNDVVDGGAGDDDIAASQGDDLLLAGAGDDTISGASGDDTLAGGAGDDKIVGASGDDTAIYNVSANVGSNDDYKGGSGTDTLLLEFTLDEWLRDDVQAEVAQYAEMLDSGGRGNKQFQFSAFDLKVKDFEALEITVDGVQLNPEDEAVTAHDDAVTGGTEHSVITGNVTDNDDVPDLVRDVTALNEPSSGTLTLDSDGSFSFDYEVTDADRDADTATVEFTITGTNDAPEIADGGDIGQAGEDAQPIASGQLTATDVDNNAVLTWIVVGADTGVYGSISVDQGGRWRVAA
jgi:hypothetical protein